MMNDDEIKPSLTDAINEPDSIVRVDRESFGRIRDSLASAFHLLSEREVIVVKLRFGLIDGRPRTLGEVAGEFGITRERVRNHEIMIFARLVRDAVDGELPPGELTSWFQSLRERRNSVRACIEEVSDDDAACRYFRHARGSTRQMSSWVRSWAVRLVWIGSSSRACLGCHVGPPLSHEPGLPAFTRREHPQRVQGSHAAGRGDAVASEGTEYRASTVPGLLPQLARYA